MSQVGAGEVVVFPTFRGFRSQVVSEVDSTGKDAGGKFSDTFGSAIKGIGAGIAVGVGAAIAGVAAVAGKGLGRALNIQDAQAQLKGLGHSAESVTQIMTDSLASVKGTAFGLDTAAKVAASAVASGIKPGADLERTLKNVADAATIAKTDMGSMGAIFNKVAASNKVQGDVINQLSDQGIPILQLLSAQLGVTTDDVLTMSKRGQIDFATFQAAMEKGLGGSALASGETARGAWANVQAALGRLGAMFTGGAVAGAPVLFASISGAVDRLATALEPLAGKFTGALTPAIAALSGWIDRIDFGVALAKMELAFGTIQNTVVMFVASFKTGDFSTFGSSLGSIGAVAQPLLPIFVAVAKGIGGISGTIGGLIAAGIPLLVPILKSFTDILGFLGDNTQILTPLILGIGGAFLIYRSAQVAAVATTIAAIPLEIARTAALVAGAFATNNLARSNTALAIATGGSTAAQGAGIATLIPATAQVLLNTAASIGNGIAQGAMKVATLAGTVATGVATAAQWAMNAAMSANPIGIVVLAIAALVAGLIWFFTQTEVGQQAWSAFTGFLTEAWANISAVGMAVFSALGSFFSDTWNNIVGFFQKSIAFLLNLFFTFNPLGIIISNWGAIVAFFGSAMSNIGNAVGSGIDGVISFFRALPGQILGAIGNLGDTLFNSGADLIQSFINGIKGMIGGVGDAIGGVMDFVGGFFPHSPAKRGPFSGAGWRAIGESGRAIIDEFQSGIPADALKLTGSFATALGGDGTGAGARTAGVGAGLSITSNVTTPPNEDPRILSRGIARELLDQMAGSR
jgi:tape measure domain-containing protein